MVVTSGKISSLLVILINVHPSISFCEGKKKKRMKSKQTRTRARERASESENVKMEEWNVKKKDSLKCSLFEFSIYLLSLFFHQLKSSSCSLKTQLDLNVSFLQIHIRMSLYRRVESADVEDDDELNEQRVCEMLTRLIASLPLTIFRFLINFTALSKTFHRLFFGLSGLWVCTEPQSNVEFYLISLKFLLQLFVTFPLTHSSHSSTWLRKLCKIPENFLLSSAEWEQNFHDVIYVQINFLFT